MPKSKAILFFGPGASKDAGAFEPSDPTHFGASVQVLIGDTGNDLADSFDLTVCSLHGSRLRSRAAVGSHRVRLWECRKRSPWDLESGLCVRGIAASSRRPSGSCARRTARDRIGAALHLVSTANFRGSSTTGMTRTSMLGSASRSRRREARSAPDLPIGAAAGPPSTHHRRAHTRRSACARPGSAWNKMATGCDRSAGRRPPARHRREPDRPGRPSVAASRQLPDATLRRQNNTPARPSGTPRSTRPSPQPTRHAESSPQHRTEKPRARRRALV